ncbi:hypothetical protein ACL02S_08590 [Nocardia sp. 004]|uniref:hypothetical protein n=1 Tax=Nocardia sp. 004 TaxID=3385978 RepID=UPI0039A32CCA
MRQRVTDTAVVDRRPRHAVIIIGSDLSGPGSAVRMTRGCSSWYPDEHGNNTTSRPGATFRLRRPTRTFDVAVHDTRTAGAEVKAGTR